MSDHSVYGPSGAARWLNCPGSIKAEAGIPDTESKYAAEGTCAHELAELCLVRNEEAKTWIGRRPPTTTEWVVTQEMADYVQEYLDYIMALEGSQEYEQEVNYEWWVPGGFGTADAIVTNGDTLYVIDFKYGKGVPVHAGNNSQGMLYALGALAERDSFQLFEKVAIVIHQPRIEHVSVWETTPDALYEFGEYAKQQALLTKDPNAKRIPGETQCRWCKAKAVCPALMHKAEHALMLQFHEMEVSKPIPPENLSDEDLYFIMHNKALIETWLKSIEAHVISRIESGGAFPGWKMVEGRSNRRWADEAEAENLLKKLLGDKAFVKKLLTAPAAEKVLGKEGKKKIQDLIIKPTGSPVLVPDDDKRAPIQTVTPLDFDVFKDPLNFQLSKTKWVGGNV